MLRQEEDRGRQLKRDGWKIGICARVDGPRAQGKHFLSGATATTAAGGKIYFRPISVDPLSRSRARREGAAEFTLRGSRGTEADDLAKNASLFVARRRFDILSPFATKRDYRYALREGDREKERN